MENIIFCDYNPEFEREARKILTRANVNIFYQTADIRSIVGENIGFVSPANSKLRFRGGIDYYYSKMYPRLEDTAEGIMSNYPQYNHMLPVGSALVIPVDSDMRQFVVAAPTMETPCNINGTANAYFAMLAALAATAKFNANTSPDNQIKTLIVPGLGTGVGGLSFFDSAFQINEAIKNYFANKDLLDELPGDPNIYLSKRA